MKSGLQKDVKRKRNKTYESKDQQNRIFREQELEYHFWLTQNLHPRKTSPQWLQYVVENSTWRIDQEW